MSYGELKMPPRTKVETVEVKMGPVEGGASPLLEANGHPAPEANGEPKSEKAPKEKKEKPPVVYAEPIEPLTKVIYPHLYITVCGSPEHHGLTEEKIATIQQAFTLAGIDSPITYAPPLTAIDAMTLIGWEVETKDGPKFRDEEVALKDYYGHKVRLHRNVRNRPIYPNNLEAISQNILNRRWELNGEPLIISETGNVLDGQHTLISVCLAQQRLEYEKTPDGTALKWTEKWPDGVISIPKIIEYGIKGTDSVVNTMNTCKPRTFTDVLYRSPYFSDLKAKSADGLDRQTAARVTDHAVKEVWQRTGLYLDGYSSRMTNSEGMAWLESHGGMEGKFLEAVRFILECDVTGHISKYIQCGKATTLLWLGGCGKSDEEQYYVLRNEDHDAAAYSALKWHNWEKAKGFWKEFGDREPDKVVNEGKDNERRIPGKTRGPLKPLTDLLEELTKTEEPVSREIDFLIARAWNLWVEEKLITTAAIKIKDTDYEAADVVTGVRHLKKKNHLRFGSLDLGMDRLKPTKVSDPEADKAIKDLKKKTQEEVEGSEKEFESREDDSTVTNAATSGKLGSVKPQVQQDVETLLLANPGLQVILMKTHSGKCEVWGSAAPVVAGLMNVVPQQHPNDTYYCKFGVEEWETLVEKVNALGYGIGLGDRVEGVLQVIMDSKPAKKNGNGHR